VFSNHYFYQSIMRANAQESKLLHIEYDLKQRKRRRSTFNEESVVEWNPDKTEEVSFDMIFKDIDFGGSQNLQISFQPPLLANLDISQNSGNDRSHKDLGCILHSSKQDISDEDITRAIHTRITKYLARTTATKRAKRLVVYKLLCLGNDSLEEVIDSVTKARNNECSAFHLFGCDEIYWWNSTPSKYYRVITHFRRISKYLCIVSKHSKMMRRCKVSLLDILLCSPDIQEFVIDSVYLHICCLSKYSCKSSKEEELMNHLIGILGNLSRMGLIRNVEAFIAVRKFVCATQPNLSGKLPGVFNEASIEIDDFSFQKKSQLWKKCLSGIEHCLVTNDTSEDNQLRCYKSGDHLTTNRRKNVLRKREFFLNQYKCRTALNPHMQNATTTSMACKLHYAEHDMSLSRFLAKTKYLNSVNESFPSLFTPGISRPKLQQLNLSTENMKALKSLFFDADGSLRDAVLQDIDLSVKHGYINFRNARCLENRNDRRWQIPIRKHDDENVISTRKAVEHVLGDGVIASDKEALYDLGIIIGGTEDQSLHHDVARRFVNWFPNEYGNQNYAFMAPVTGWEVDRLAYNAAMSSSNAPASILLGMSNDQEVLLGVQKDQIIRIGDTVCRIKGGIESQSFDIVRENDFLVVIRANKGLLFTGDFPHAGVKNVLCNSNQERLLMQLNKRIDFVLDHFEANDRLAQIKAVLSILCNFPSLDTLCRLHCSTEMKLDSLRIPTNSVGFYSCQANPPGHSMCENKEVQLEENSKTNIVSPSHSSYLDDTFDTQEEWRENAVF
jgi:hypothetical protein